jgi:RNA polymerase sporulation-specific sigma factor
MAEEIPGQSLDVLVHRAAGGEKNALSLLLVSFHPLIKGSAGDFAGGDSYLFDDLYQEGMVALCRAVVSFDSKRGAFPALARRCVRNAMISHLRKTPREILVDEFDESDLAGLAPDGSQDVELRDDLRRLLEVLSPVETAVLDAFLQTGSVASAVKILGWPRKKVDNALMRIRRKYREDLSSGDVVPEFPGPGGASPLA